MQRHASLQGLSRDHHHALVVARTLREGCGAIVAAADPPPDETSALISHVRAEWAAHVTPHFEIEERELLPLCHGSNMELVAHADVIRQDHAVLRSMLTGLTVASLATAGAALANRLESHVRFEERVWFPSLEAHLDADTLASLQWRLDLEPRVPIASIGSDEEDSPGTWTATLACGHSQHVRHKPPFQRAEWVTTAEGRMSMIGTRLPCVLCRMPRLPPTAVCYKETLVFDQESVPAGLLASHTLRAGTWGEVVVVEGKVDYIIEGTPALSFVLRPAVSGTIAPERPHYVRLQAGARFKVRFLR